MTSILIAGVATAWLQEASTQGIDIGTRNDPTKIAASAKILQQDLKSFHNTTFEIAFLHPGDASKWKKFVSVLRSRKWDCVSLGGGVRTIPELGDYFTDLVREVVREQPGARLIFPLLPEDAGPAIRKYLPQAS
ncbi:hypothetical protein M409DRAFT_49709 [Zasmidium cellare ATCC 36951]|uniref:Uncharacterized protein n=1 Tax=Zasmidium cellare ATCC 36951 TaxID=1080233 RepID=A0A6A6D6E1_ZASCE|nr:uncharacterized protein M409DRAFT_49709 [Zasmidium cellare ATCC 36951]KAF2173236.1 hypothetical protein M409DRAFT_49709 [Zasmidium cellare ATCC 36951]